jgi:hypothetical protein
MPGSNDAATRPHRRTRGAPGRPKTGTGRRFSLSEFPLSAGTAFIPLVARARARALFPELGFADAEAERMTAALGIPPDLFGTDQAWMCGIVLRAKWFDDNCRRFFTANRDGLGIALPPAAASSSDASGSFSSSPRAGRSTVSSFLR